MAVRNLKSAMVSMLLLFEDTVDTDTEDIADNESVVVFFAASVVREERTKIQSYTEQVVPHYLLDDFKRFFRVSRSTFEILYQNISVYDDLAPGARVLKNCDLWEEGSARCGDAHIIGDAAYPIRKWLLTPYRNNGHLSRQQQHFNTALSTTRVTIERAFGMFKGRFSRLQNVDTKEIRTTVDLVVTCCILHNICILNEDDVFDHFEDDNDILPDGVQVLQGMDEAEGIRKREYIARNL